MLNLSEVSPATLFDLEKMTHSDFRTARTERFEGAKSNYAAVVAELQRRGLAVRDLDSELRENPRLSDFDPWEIRN